MAISRNNEVLIKGAVLTRQAKSYGMYHEMKNLLAHCESLIEPCSLFTGFYVVDDLLYVAQGKNIYPCLIAILNRMGVL